jgi:hypothetical protein
VQLVRSFFQIGIMPSHINDTHIALILKKLVRLVPADYRPISLCNAIYKIIAKCITNRLKPHLPDYIHPSQQAFIEGMRISNNIIIAQEITHSFALCLKLILPKLLIELNGISLSPHLHVNGCMWSFYKPHSRRCFISHFFYCH